MPHVKVVMRLPFRIQVAENTEFQVPQDDGSVLHISIREYEVPKAEGEAHGSGTDDGRGTYLQSTLSVTFPNQSLEEIRRHPLQNYRSFAMETVNQFINAYRLVSKHASAHQVEKSAEWNMHILDEAGNPLPNEIMECGTDFETPIGPKATLSPQGVKLVQEVLSGARTIEYERLLLLDAEYFAMIGDVRHAIFNADTALQVFIDRALASEPPSRDYYSKWDDGLNLVHGISPHYFTFKSHPFKSQPSDITFMEIVEGIHIVRNEIAHKGRAVFALKYLGK